VFVGDLGFGEEDVVGEGVLEGKGDGEIGDVNDC
jgi:hypothetical protein